MKRCCFFLILTCALSAVYPAGAQSLLRSDTERKKTNAQDMFVLGGDATGVYVGFADDFYYQGSRNKTVVARYGPDLKQQTARVLQAAERKDDIFYTFYFQGRVHTLVAADGNRQGNNVWLESYDEQLEKAGTKPVTTLLPGLFTFSPAGYMRAYFSSQYGRMRFSRLVSHRVSDNGDHLLLVFNYQYLGLGEGGIHAVMLDKNLEKVWEKTLMPPRSTGYTLNDGVAVTNGGEVYLLMATFDNDKFRKTPTGFSYQFYQYKAEQAALREVPFETGGRFVINLGLTLDARQQPLLGGIYADPVTMEPTGSVGMRFAANGKATVVATDFDATTTAALKSKRDERSNAPEYNVKAIFAESDGGLTFFAESYYRGPVLTAKLSLSRGVRPDVEIGDIYAQTAAVRLGGDLKPRWQQVIEKRQQSTEDRDIYASLVVQRSGDGYQVLFNDKIKTVTDVQTVRLGADGAVTTEVLLDRSQDRVRIMPPLAAVVPELGLLVPAEKPGAQLLLRLPPGTP